MSIPVITAPQLKKETKRKILNKEYSEEELKLINQAIINSKSTAKESFITDAVIVLLILVSSLFSAPSDIIWPLIWLFAGLYILFLLLLYYFMFKRMRRQFLKLVKKAYPELVGTFN